MDIQLLPDERIDDLQRNGYRIIQNKNGFCFGMDAVLLSGFLCEGMGRKITEKTKILDLGTGTGILPILLRGKTLSRDITGLEIQKDYAEMASRSVKLNDLEDSVKIVEGDLCEASHLFGRASFDVVVSNPPYMKPDGGLTNPSDEKAIARHEIKCTFADVARETAALLVPGGRFFLVHRPERLTEIFAELKKNRLEIKRMRMVHSFADSQATMVLIEAVSGGNVFMKVEKPLIIYKAKNEYTDEIHEIYHF